MERNYEVNQRAKSRRNEKAKRKPMKAKDPKIPKNPKDLKSVSEEGEASHSPQGVEGMSASQAVSHTLKDGENACERERQCRAAKSRTAHGGDTVEDQPGARGAPSAN